MLSTMAEGTSLKVYEDYQNGASENELEEDGTHDRLAHFTIRKQTSYR